MHRIDSATARANANGDGKTGFHDNSDLPNQDATYFTPEWSNALQEEVAGVIEGLGLALDKSDNGQLLKALVQQFGEKKVLEDAIKDYKAMFEKDRERLDELESRTYEDTQIGELFWTSKHFATAAEVAEYKGYGTWQRALQGRVAVGFSADPEDHVDFRTHGKLYGEREHTLTLEETPEHKHSQDDVFDKFGSNASESGLETQAAGDYNKQPEEYGTGDLTATDWERATEQSRGGNQPHNNMQPSQTLDCWERVT
ncbi:MULTISPECIES: phage baseplate protein [unclassified Psychrobacter]|uniref:phage baseplate protein n=1 Tax=unclassified Psychrobacter TaxID=196806 RepID=UPI0018F29AC5|nr:MULTISPECIES: hypothetical protein [unclassified Psychrobacter]